MTPDATADRATAVLESALRTFARQGYSGTSMEQVAREARISRPGLYLYFASKQALLRAAVDHALSRDVAAAELVLVAAGTPIGDRLLEALDLWTGQYVGPLAVDIDALLAGDASLLGDLPRTYGDRFASAVTAALRREGGVADVDALREVLLALVAGLKHRVADREEFRSRLRDGLGLLLR